MENLEVIAVRVGTRAARRSEVFLNYHLYDLDDSSIDVDYYFWVIRSSHQVIVVDTGFSAEGGTRRHRNLLIEPKHALEKLGINPDKVSHLILTHAHYDHIGNVGLFPQAEVIIAQSEYDFWLSPVAENIQFSYYSDREDLALLSALDREGRLHKFSGELRLTPQVRLEEVGGHTPGQTIVYVDCPDQAVLLASDAVHFYEELQKDMPFCAVSDLPQMLITFRQLREAEHHTLVPGHDRLVMEEYPPHPQLSKAVLIAGNPE